MSCATIFESPYDDFGSNLEAQEAPKSNPKPEKSMLKNNTFLVSIFSGFWFVFGRVHTLKIELPPRREHDFWKINVSQTYAKKHWFWVRNLRFLKHVRVPFPKKQQQNMFFENATLCPVLFFQKKTQKHCVWKNPFFLSNSPDPKSHF